MNDLYQRARPVVDRALQELDETADRAGAAGHEAERLMVYLTGVVLAYMAEHGLVGKADIARGIEYGYRVAWAISGLIFNVATSMPRGLGIAQSFEWWLAQIASAGAHRIRSELAGEGGGNLQFELSAEGELRERPFDFRELLRRPQ